MHYGEERGLDSWSGYAAVVTVGEPWPHKARSGARDGEAWRERMTGALVQAWGRLRPVHRKDDCLLVHCGNAIPDADAAPQWIGCSLFDRDRRLDVVCGVLARYQVSAGEYAKMSGMRESEVRLLASEAKNASESKGAPSTKTSRKQPKTILLYNRIDTHNIEASSPAPAKNKPVTGTPQDNRQPEQTPRDRDDSFGEGAPPREQRRPPKEYPFPTHELLGCPSVPAPPRLSRDAADREIAFALIVAYRACCAEFFPKSKAKKWAKQAPDITKLKVYPQLVEAGRMLAAEGIPPSLWAAWSFANAAELAKEKLAEPPTISFVFSPKRVSKFTGWYFSEVWWEAGRRHLVGPLAQGVIDRFRRAEIAFTTGQAGTFEAALMENFPETYEVALTRAKEQGERAQDKLRRRAAVGEHVWCLNYARVMKLAGLDMPYTRQRR